MPVLYLASKSPRRREILASMGITDITLLPAGAPTLQAYAGDETQLPGESGADYAVRTARSKALDALARIASQALPPAPVLSADTVVLFQNRVFGKPIDRREAAAFMLALSGRTHEVRTAVFVGTSARDLACRVSVSEVTFAPMTERQIQAYVHTSEPYDKAGGYAVQGLAARYIQHIAGSYSGIMGLPVFETAQLLQSFGVLSDPDAD